MRRSYARRTALSIVAIGLGVGVFTSGIAEFAVLPDIELTPLAPSRAALTHFLMALAGLALMAAGALIGARRYR
jgi:hypothetical protein